MTAVTEVFDLADASEARSFDWGYVQYVPLAAVLAVQAVLSAQLMHLGYASGDEARYIYAGHQLIHEFWHGGGSPYFETYFSGAPDFYSPVAAVVDHVAGLAGVRLMSNLLMLVTTTLLFTVTRRLFSYTAGLTAAGLFAGLGLTHVLGAYADYDSLALMLTAAAVYCAIRTGEYEQHGSRWLLLVPVVILLANTAKYMTVVFDPAVIAIAALQLQPQGWRPVVKRLIILGASTGALLVAALYLAGTAYASGILFTTLNRPSGTQVVIQAVRESSHVIVGVTWAWVGLVIVLSAAAPILALTARSERRLVLALAVFAAAGVLVTVEGLHLHTAESMKRHDDFSAWFSCVAAGYALAFAIDHVRSRYVKVGLLAPVGALIVFCGVYYTPTGPVVYPAHTNVAQVQAFYVLKPYLELPAGRFLLGGLADDLMLYTDHLDVPWYQHFDDVYIKYPIPGRGGDSHGQATGRACLRIRPGCMYLEGAAGYRAAIHAHWFSLITMIGQHGVGFPTDAAIVEAVERTPGYVLVSHADGQPTWIYAPSYARSMR